jgi:hypothetical protein
MHIRSVLPLNVTSDQLISAIHATVAGLAAVFQAVVHLLLSSRPTMRP